MGRLTLSLNQISKENVDLCGGKGASLGELIKIGMPVPNGFVVTTNAYGNFLKENGIKVGLKGVDVEDSEAVGFVSDEFQKLIFEGKVNPKLQKEIILHFNKLNCQFVAVRSSATAEDATRTSWAGQLSTYLNTQKKDLIDNIKRCWASLFNPRAISYRASQGLLEADIAVAVIVQKMVEAEVSGIVFTAHPVTKDPDMILLEAGFGLGEAMVAGMVTPDTIMVDKETLRIIDYKIGRQKKMITKEGALDVPEEKQKVKKLAEGKIAKLTELCIKIETHYKAPQDIEWAMEKERLYILQSRPITTF